MDQHTPPPCDEDFAALSPAHSPLHNNTQSFPPHPSPQPSNLNGASVITDAPFSTTDTEAYDDDDASLIEKRNHNQTSYAELRRLQRLMMSVAESDEMGSARASAARAWRDLEVLRHAKRGKPLMLNVTGKGEAPKAKAEAGPIIDSAAA